MKRYIAQASLVGINIGCPYLVMVPYSPGLTNLATALWFLVAILLLIIGVATALMNTFIPLSIIQKAREDSRQKYKPTFLNPFTAVSIPASALLAAYPGGVYFGVALGYGGSFLLTMYANFILKERERAEACP